ncbi:hypothetical protein KDD93_08075 [Campylobacter sp. faydin G-24]|uniref:Uncharacterized protein n=1 Tax=Campylobacter anatolicus TaxID=2829105 RepID=A0ABS5HK52_9BACT|nr:hypothetical protein [Campylobacter anatolicus]MBR8461298.1 hypothetical protein [Campylobacter anatolicus]MBR8464518.1 hypothetical protein [Campylobacter anatolicus]MBR8466269.1 hypothetical protein [Campylobacter anatolicus]
MTSAIFFFSLWIIALYGAYKFVHLNIKHVEKHEQRYFENLNETDETEKVQH